MCEISKGDDVTINGTVVDVEGHLIVVRTKSGDLKVINAGDINTVRPKTIISNVDMRKGN